MVINENGQKAGELILQGEGGSTSGVFTGDVSVVDGANYRVWYLGAANGEKGAYTTFTEESKVLATQFAQDDENSVSGQFDDLKRADLMTGVMQLHAVDGKATNTKDVNLEALHAMAHFRLTNLPEGISNENATLTVSNFNENGVNTLAAAKTYANAFNYGDGTEVANDAYGYKVTGVDFTAENVDVYLPFFTGDVKLTFDLLSGDDHYSYTFENSTDLINNYYCSI